ncbi:MAG: hypothetical protein ACI89U_003302 [Gammaproteobacteria bacterium]
MTGIAVERVMEFYTIGNNELVALIIRQTHKATTLKL